MKKKFFCLMGILLLVLSVFSACGLSSSGKAQLTEDMIFSSFVGETYVYSGEPITFDNSALDVRVDGRVVSSDLFEMEFSNNLEAGTANVKITAKPENAEVKGSVTVHFYIAENDGVHCEKDDDLVALLAGRSVAAVEVWSDYTIPEGTVVTVPSGKVLSLKYGYHLRNYGTIENYGKIELEGAHMYRGGRKESELTNYGSLLNHGEIEIKDYVTINDLGTFSSDSEITNRGKIYLCDADKSFLSDEDEGARFIRKRLQSEDISVAECVCYKNKSIYEPKLSLKGASGVAFTAEYSNNTGAGVAEVRVEVGERENFYYGSAITSFPIEKGSAEFSGTEEFLSLSESGNFAEYTSSSLSVKEGESFTLSEGERLILSSTLRVGGTLRNGGEISCRGLNLSSSGAFVNDGALAVRGNSFEVSGDFTLGAEGSLEYAGYIRVEENGTFRNAASLDWTPTFTIVGKLLNEGTLSAKFAYVTGIIENLGSLTFPEGVSMTGDKCALANASGGRLLIKGDSYLASAVTNHGTITNEGRIAFADGATYAGAGGFDNSEGGVWAFVTIPNVRENLIVKKYLTDESVDFEVEYSEIHYDKSVKIPTFTIDGECLPEEECGSYCIYTDREAQPKAISLAGNVRLNVYIRTNYSRYAGTITHDYEILRSAISVKTREEFSAASADEGYDRIVLDADVELGRTSSDSILKTCTLDLNGHRLRINKSFYLYGNLMGGAPLESPYVPSEEGVGIFLGEGGYFANYGSITNEGILYVEGDAYFNGNAVRENPLYTKGSIQNNGVIYTNSRYALTASGEGRLYARKKMKDLRDNITVPTAVYDGAEQEPLPGMVYLGESVDISRFALEYAMNVEAGSGAQVRLTVKDAFDENFYDMILVTFTIRRGKATVSSSEELISAANNANYDNILLSGNITLTESVILSDGQTLDLDLYELSFASKAQLTYGANCRLLLKADEETRLIKYIYGADEITLTEDIGVIGTPTALRFTGYSLPCVTGANYLSTIVHMNGYSFLGGLTIVNSNIENFAFTFENSSENESKIGSDVGGYALRYGTCYEETYVTLKNLTVYGVYHYGGSGTAQVVDLSAENCTFLAARNTKDAYAFKIWTSMTASGTYTDCVFDGANAFYVNVGYEYDHDSGTTLPAYFFNNCTLRAYGTCDNNDFYGNALTMDRNRSNLYVKINASSLYSQNGNCIRITNQTGVYCSVDEQTNFEHPEGKSNILV